MRRRLPEYVPGKREVPMSTTRDRLQAELTRIDGLIPKWLHEHGPGPEFWNVIAGETDAITEQATAEETEWANRELDAVLRKHGVAVPTDEPPVDG
jgi:hypothetical protein